VHTPIPRHRRSLIAVVALLLATSGAGLQAQTTLGSPRRDVATFTGDIWSVWTSPARFDHRDVAPLAITVSAFAITTRVDSTIRAWMVTHDRTAVMRALWPIREGARLPAYELGSGQYLLPVAGALYLGGRLSHSPDVRDAGLGCAAGHLSSLGIRAVAYSLVARERPRESVNPFRIGIPGSHDWMWHSFFSGHIANSMACASFLGHRYSLGAIEAIPYTYAALIGAGRMADGAHWASDTMLGAIVGFAIGREIAARQLDRRAPTASTTPTVTSSATRTTHHILIPIATLEF
jgi:membrane-associated phospholipid phosphatase